MKKRYKFTGKRHSRWGMASSGIGAAALILTAGALAFAYLQSGQAGKYIALLGFLALLLSAAGLYCGIRGSMEEDVYRLFSRLGCAVNGMLLIVFVWVYAVGW